MKKNLFLTLAMVVMLVSCGGNSSSIGTSLSSSSSSSSSSATSVNDISKTNKDFEYAKTTYIKDGTEYNLNMNTLYTNDGHPHLDPLTEQHVMVVPFGFTNPELQSIQTQENIVDIERTFFGTENGEPYEDSEWVSVAEYYRQSSYGKSNFQGKVLNTWCVFEGTTTDMFNQQTSTKGLGHIGAEYVQSWYVKEYKKDNHGALGADAEPLSYFDHDDDGYIDLIWMVYSAPTSTAEPRDWWAYVSYNPAPVKGTIETPKYNTLGWAGIDWMNKGYKNDPHTFIHETGHTYGLDDYYDYQDTWAPMGGIDMMDHNLGDHSAFSKFTLGWLSPLVVDDEAIITLRPTTTTGDCFIIPSPNYNGTAFDEYMMFEFIAPVGLNERDYTYGYQGTNGYTKPGIRVTHIDARVWDGKNHDTYLSTNPEDGIGFRISNSYAGRNNDVNDTDHYVNENNEKKYFTLASIIERSVNAENNATTSKTYSASDNSLFTKNTWFNLSDGSGWASIYMPSQSNLWNKAKTITGWRGSEQIYTVDETCTFDFDVEILDIVADEENDYIATIKVTKA